MRSRFLKFRPADPQLSNRTSNGAQLQIATAPIRNHGHMLVARIEPFPMRASSSASQLMATQDAQFANDFSISHGEATSVSNHTGACSS